MKLPKCSSFALCLVIVIYFIFPTVAPAPPPPVPPADVSSAPVSSPPSGGRGALLNSICGFNKGALKKSDTVDKSGPRL